MDQQKPPVSAKEQQLTDDIAVIAKELTDLSLNRATIDEPSFAKVFLPMFAGDNDADPKITPNIWFNLAHGPFNEVDVVDPTTGNVLFSVPPFFSQKYVNPMDGTGQSSQLPTIGHMMAHANNVGVRGVNAMHNYIENEMRHRNFMFNDKADVSAETDRWNAIFARYGRKLLPTNKPAVAASNDSTGASTEFDPL